MKDTKNIALVVKDHDIKREMQVQELCKAVLEVSAIHFDDPNGPYLSECPFCYSNVHEEPVFAEMSDIQHEPNCAYLIAKDLTTNTK